jgi:hypothetical protein
MRMIRKKLPTFEGVGHVRFAGHAGPVNYAIEGDPAKLRAGIARLRGSFTTTAELAEMAFRAGEGVLMLEGGAQFRVVMLGHSAGGPDVFVELRV